MDFPVKVTALIVTILLLVFSLVSGEEGRRPITAEDLWNMKRLGSLRLSPSGELAAIVVTEYDIEKNEGQGDIWIAATDGSWVRRFTTGEGTESSPAWSPCGKRLAFTAKREGKKSQLYVIPIEGGEAEKVTGMPLGVSYPKWVPGGGGIIFVSRVLPGFEADMDSMKAELERRDESKVTAKVTEDRLYRYWDHWLTDGEIPHFFKADLKTGEITDLTPGWERYFTASGRVSYDISPDGDEIAFTALRHGSPYDSLTTDIFLLSIDTPGSYRNITVENPSNDFSPYYTPDGRYILYGKQRIIGFYGDRVRLVRFDRETGEKKLLTGDFDRSPSGWVAGKKGKRVYFIAGDRAMRSLFSVGMDGGAVREILRRGTNSAVDVLPGGRLIFLHQSNSQPNAVCTVKKNGGDFKKLT